MARFYKDNVDEDQNDDERHLFEDLDASTTTTTTTDPELRRPRLITNSSFINYDPKFAGLTLSEKKVALVNRELDSHGMGTYQWWIFFLCGFG